MRRVGAGAAVAALLLAGAACGPQRGGVAPSPPLSPTPQPTTPMSEPIRLATAGGTLEGTLTYPTSPAPWPVVLLVSGSGPTDRDGNTAGLPGPNNSLRMLAEGLAGRGIASVRYDKRGIAASRAAGLSEADLRFDTFADDAAAWIRQLRGDARFTTITVVGHSEGSLLGMLAAQRAGADGFVSIAGAGRPAANVLHEQIAAHAPAEITATSDRILEQLKAGKTVDSVPPNMGALFRPSVQPYLISWFRYDPAAQVRALRVPVLIAQGTTDLQVSVEDARLLATAKPDATLVVVDGMNHVLKIVPADLTTQVRSYSDPSLPVAPELIESIARFVTTVRR
ncbi:MAG TPA: alpha/beta fold hydrolase [Gemmatimonadaceae bacterium]